MLPRLAPFNGVKSFLVREAHVKRRELTDELDESLPCGLRRAINRNG